METFFTGRILGSQMTEFIGTNNEAVKYNTYHIKTDTPSGDILVINSSKDFTEFEGKHAEFALKLRQEGKLWKVTLVGCTIKE